MILFQVFILVAVRVSETHKLAGQLLEYMVPVHVGGAVAHSLMGHSIFYRITPFLKAPKPKV